jgi:Domain of unknown function (DUF892)
LAVQLTEAYFDWLAVHASCSAGRERVLARKPREGANGGREVPSGAGNKYLADAHSIEEQALAQLEVAPRIAEDPKLAGVFEKHLTETCGHEAMTQAHLEAFELESVGERVTQLLPAQVELGRVERQLRASRPSKRAVLSGSQR